jgi:hypothetical protein
VSFASGKDARLVTDIEKLIKTKIELEPIEFDEDIPDIRRQGRINDGRRMYAADESREQRDGRSGQDRMGHDRGPRRDISRPAPVQRDPFFDKPYEAPATDAAPSWEATPRQTTARSISANIKVKRKVAALFKTQ